MGIDIGFLWIGAVIVFVVIEAVTYQLVSVWFAVGSVGGLIAYMLGFGFGVQMTVFLILSVVTLLCLRPLSMKLLKPKGFKTNADSLVGKEVLITKAVSNVGASGEGKINGMTWTVRSEDGSDIDKGAVAVVKKIEGVKLIVERKGD